MAPLLLALVLGDRLEASFRLALTMSGGNYLTFMDKGTVVVLTSVVGLLLAVQALAWAFGYRKSISDEAGSA
jgi:TctA family transporter